MSKFVVAGVTGHVGSVVARDLLAGGDAVTVIVRDAKKGAEWSCARRPGRRSGRSTTRRSWRDRQGRRRVLHADPAALRERRHLRRATEERRRARRRHQAERGAAGGAALVGGRRPRRPERAHQEPALRREQAPRDRDQAGGGARGLVPGERRRRDRGGQAGRHLSRTSCRRPICRRPRWPPGHRPRRRQAAQVAAGAQRGGRSGRSAYSSRQMAEKLGKLLGKTLPSSTSPPPATSPR